MAIPQWFIVMAILFDKKKSTTMPYRRQTKKQPDFT